MCARLAQLFYCLPQLQEVIGWSSLSLGWQLSPEVAPSVTEPCFVGIAEGSVLQELPQTLSSFTCYQDVKSQLTHILFPCSGRQRIGRMKLILDVLSAVTFL